MFEKKGGVVCPCAGVCVQLNVCLCMCSTYVCIFAYVQACTYIHAHIYMHIFPLSGVGKGWGKKRGCEKRRVGEEGVGNGLLQSEYLHLW